MVGDCMRLSTAVAADFAPGQYRRLVPDWIVSAPEPAGEPPVCRSCGHLVMAPATAAVGGDEILGFFLNKSAVRTAERRLSRNGAHEELCGHRNGKNLAREVLGRGGSGTVCLGLWSNFRFSYKDGAFLDDDPGGLQVAIEFGCGFQFAAF